MCYNALAFLLILYERVGSKKLKSDPDPVTENTCPGVVGVVALYPRYETHAWFTFAGSIAMLLIARPGAFAASAVYAGATASSRVNATVAGSPAFAFREMNRRPVVVEAHTVWPSDAVRLIQPTLPPLRVLP